MLIWQLLNTYLIMEKIVLMLKDPVLFSLDTKLIVYTITCIILINIRYTILLLALKLHGIWLLITKNFVTLIYTL